MVRLLKCAVDIKSEMCERIERTQTLMLVLPSQRRERAAQTHRHLRRRRDVACHIACRRLGHDEGHVWSDARYWRRERDKR